MCMQSLAWLPRCDASRVAAVENLVLGKLVLKIKSQPWSFHLAAFLQYSFGFDLLLLSSVFLRVLRG